jgi:hypothetical protein
LVHELNSARISAHQQFQLSYSMIERSSFWHVPLQPSDVIR